MNDPHNTADIGIAGIKAAPPVLVAALELGGISLNDWVLIATLVYVVLQAFVLIRDKIWPSVSVFVSGKIWPVVVAKLRAWIGSGPT